MAVSKGMQRNYKYTISADFLLEKQSYTLEVNSLIIDNNYEKMFTPISFMYVSIPENVYALMVNNKDKGRIVVSVNTYNVDNEMSKLYFRKIFYYNFPSLNTKESNPDAKEKNTSGADNTYKRTYIGLIDIDALNRNKMIINNLFTNSNMASIVHSYLKQDIIREPFDYNPDFNLFFVPPIGGIPEFLSYLNSKSSFYTTSFRYFDGYKCAYLLSNKGKGIDIKDGSFSTYNINIVNNEKNPGSTSNVDGFFEDINQKVYIIQVVDELTKLEENTVQDNIFNQLYAISYDGSSRKIDMDIHHINENKTKPRFMRVFDNNLNYANSQANNLELSSDTVVITQYSLDNSKLDPSKEFVLTFPENNKYRNGNYLLVRKTESYKTVGNEFACTTVMFFKKVRES